MIPTPRPRFAPAVIRALPRRRAGFTLVELLLVVMILGIMAGVAAPKYQAALDGVALEAAAKRLVADLRHTRQEAMRRSTTLGLDFDPATESYVSPALSGQSVADPEHPSRALSVTLDNRVGIESTLFASDELRFDFRGDPSEAGSVVLSNGAESVNVAVTQHGYVGITP